MRETVRHLGGPVGRSSASLRVSGVSLRPEAFSAAVGLEPSHAHAAGDLVSPRLKSVRKEGMWMLDSAGDGPSVEEHLRWLLGRLPEKRIWLEASEGLKVDIVCSVTIEAENQGFSLSAETLRSLGELGIELSFEVWAELGDDDSEDAEVPS
jgi:hypothetical protein